MTEAEWLACTEPQKMLKSFHGKANQRKLRLFLCGCCRVVDSLSHWSEARGAVETAERFADDLASVGELSFARGKISYAYYLASLAKDEPIYYRPGEKREPRRTAAELAAARLSICSCEINAARTALDVSWDTDLAAYHRMHANLVREIFGNPFRVLTLERAWLAWDGNTVPKLAQTIYQERRWEDLPILADALEEAGCTNADILNHCRQPGEHVRGCWVVDLILGRR